MNDSIEELLTDALKLSVRNPRELLFLARFKAAHEKASRKRRESEAEGVHIPPFLIASIARDCNLRCAGCYAAVNQACATQSAQLPAERWDAIFRQAQELGISFILLAGGEPLMRPDVIKNASRNKSIIFPVFTNGTLIDDGWAGLFHKHRNLIPVLSIEGDREATDNRRGTGVYDRLCFAMDKLHKQKVFYGVSVTVTKNNIAEVTDRPFVSFLSENGCSIAFYVEYVPADEKTRDLAPGDGERAYLAEKLEEIRRLERFLAIAFPGDEKLLGGCLAAGRGFFHINPSGGAEPCPFSPYSDISLKDCSLLEALQSPLFKKLQSSGILHSEHDGGCVLFENSAQVEQMLV
ncbi:MAG: radical SAM protein [Bacillota bacterium]